MTTTDVSRRRVEAEPRAPGGAPPLVRIVDGDRRPGLAGVDPATLASWLADRGEPAYRARHAGDAAWPNQVPAAGGLRTLPAQLRGAVDRVFRVDTIADSTIQQADAGLTE